MATATVATMLLAHRLVKTWVNSVNLYVATTNFARHKFIEAGIPAAKIIVKPNFVAPDPGPGDARPGYFLYVGRLSSEKGVTTLLHAWRSLGCRSVLKIAGDGPSACEVLAAVRSSTNVDWLGWQPRERILELMKGACALVVPSSCYEGFPVVVAEAFATGLPVVASATGSLVELIHHRATGLLFRRDDRDDLAASMDWILSNPSRLADMRRAARDEYATKYTAEINYQALMQIYERALSSMN
jgi:glycosyltransferase involved in cell wall biosynthesis